MWSTALQRRVSHLFDAMQVVQGFGRVRQYMRSSTGQIFFAAPEALSEKRSKDDEERFTRLLNENLVSEEDKALFRATMTSGGGARLDHGCSIRKQRLRFEDVVDFIWKIEGELWCVP